MLAGYVGKTTMIIPKLRAPIVLGHGICGFDELRLGSWRLARYWPGIPEALTRAGNRVLVARVAPLGTVAERAAQLKAFLDREAPGEPVHLISHSMGGLDARYLISCLGMAPRVLSLTTISTPHRGTAFADWGLRTFEPWAKGFLRLFGVRPEPFRDVSIDGCARFNREVLDAPGVRYFSVAAEFQLNWLAAEWQLPYRIIAREQGANDGMVPVVSARYGEDCTIWKGDHVSLVNWTGPLAGARRGWRDRIPEYASLVGRLADEGF